LTLTGTKVIATRVSRAGPPFAPLIRSTIDAGSRVVRPHERRVQTTPDGIRLEEVDGGFARGLRIVEGMAPPGSASGLMSDADEEHHLVLEGTIRLRQGDFATELGPRITSSGTAASPIRRKTAATFRPGC
jgi:hypothetical protein